MNNNISNIVNASSTPVVRDIGSQKTETDIADNVKSSNLSIEAETETETKGFGTTVTSLDEARKLAEEGNKILENIQRDLQFKVDDSTQQVVMSIVDKRTGEIIKQIPSEEALNLAKRMQESGGNVGEIVHHKA